MQEISPADRALMQAVVKLWEEHWPERELTAHGVEDGIPWAVGPGPLFGLCGYAIIPAEGHPWSARWPNDIDQERDQARTRANLAKFQGGVDKGLSPAEAVREIYGEEEVPDRAYLDDFLSCHGGITWYQHPFVGFDAMHSGDSWDGTEWEEKPIPGMRTRITDMGRSWRKQWSLELICEEAKRLARQVAEVRNLQQAFDLDAAAVAPEPREG